MKKRENNKEKVMKNIRGNLKSNCCNAEIKIDMTSDFYGDNPKTMQIGTCYYVCIECKQACDVHSNQRRTWKINPVTKIKGDERDKIKEKELNKEIKEIGHA
jgi:hypothetical protein